MHPFYRAPSFCEVGISSPRQLARWLISTYLFLAIPAFVGFASDPREVENEAIRGEFLREHNRIEVELAALDETLTHLSDEQWRDTIVAWHEQNAARFRQQQERSKLLPETSGLAQTMEPDEAPLPTERTEAARDAVAERQGIEAELQALRWQLRNFSLEQRRNALCEWHERNATRLARADETLQAATSSDAAIRLLSRSAVVIPPTATPAEREVIVERASIDNDLLELDL